MNVALKYLAIVTVLAVAVPLRAIIGPMPPVGAPVERLLASAEKQLASQPDSVDAHYHLARAHYLALARDFEGIDLGLQDKESARGGGFWLPFTLAQARKAKAAEFAYSKIKGADYEGSQKTREMFFKSYREELQHLEKSDWRPSAGQPEAVSLDHAVAAWRELQIARTMQPENSLYLLSEASFTEQFVRWAAARKPAQIPEALRGLTFERARESYLKAFRGAFPVDGKIGSLTSHGMGGPRESKWDLISYEAGMGFLRVSAQDEAISGRSELDEIRAGLARMDKIRVQTIVTPVLLALEPVASLGTLLAADRTVSFDLAGYGVSQPWPWVGPQAGLLVWDPERRGVVTSGRQLFGNFTFQLFWKDGYAALAALDDDGDGELSGAELTGIRVWFDRNGDGVSTPEEVRDLADVGVAGLAVRATSQDGLSPMNPQGVRLADGRVLPTWDWTVEPVKN